MRCSVLSFTKVLSVIFIVLGIAGYFVGDSILLFQVDPMHNWFHLGTGLVGLLALKEGETFARWFLILVGAVYGVLAADGFLYDGATLGLFPVNEGDNYLHLLIAVLALVVGLEGRNLRQKLRI